MVCIGCTESTVVDTGSTRHSSLPSISRESSLPYKERGTSLRKCRLLESIYYINSYNLSRLSTIQLTE